MERAVFFSFFFLGCVSFIRFIRSSSCSPPSWPTSHLPCGGASRLTEIEAKRVTMQLLEGLSYLHSKGIVHCDIKPQNLLFAPDPASPDAPTLKSTKSSSSSPSAAAAAAVSTSNIAPDAEAGAGAGAGENKGVPSVGCTECVCCCGLQVNGV